MLYLDQPVQVGLSYDVLVNITTDLLTGDITILNVTDETPQQNNTFLVGTYPSQNVNSTARGTENGARALWHFAQVWFQEFPVYHPNDSRISIATESYGGRYGPAYSAFFEEQNQKIENGTWTDVGEMYVIHLDTLMIINGCIDRQVQWPSYPHIAYNNTYGIQTVNESVYSAMLDAYTRPNGCRDQISTCRSLSILFDPTNQGINSSVNHICQAAESFCTANVRDPYLDYSGHNYYDFATLDPDPNPPPFYIGYLNQPHVQAALGVPLNWTQSSGPVASAFRAIGDYPRPGWLEDLNALLDGGVKVALIYGDRDYACNWIGGEAVSLALNHRSAADFRAAGYQALQTNASYVGGQVRQHGNLSFGRVYESGHEVPFYQPETAYHIFNHALFNRDIATGAIDIAAVGNYSTQGPSSSWSIKNEVPEQPRHFCYVLDPTDTCTEAQLEQLRRGEGSVREWVLVDSDGGNATTTSGGPTSSVGSSPVATGGAGLRDRAQAVWKTILVWILVTGWWF